MHLLLLALVSITLITLSTLVMNSTNNHTTTVHAVITSMNNRIETDLLFDYAIALITENNNLATIIITKKKYSLTAPFNKKKPIIFTFIEPNKIIITLQENNKKCILIYQEKLESITYD